jgi:hypothetical protein
MDMILVSTHHMDSEKPDSITARFFVSEGKKKELTK